MRTAIVGGGAAGFFLAINLKEMCPQMQVTLFERSQRVLQKVKVSGGGRCNCTNSFEEVHDLSAVYPRGHRLMKRLMKGFNQQDAFAWFERHGVPLVVQADHCVFPAAQDSQVIIDCFLSHARRLGVEVRTNCRIDSLDALADYDFIALTMGGQPRMEGLQWLADMGHEIEKPVPSLFTFSIKDNALHDLMGTVVEPATAFIPGTRFKAEGPVLITHWGMSGPAILKLSSYVARYLAEENYHATLAINWANSNEEEVRQHLADLINEHPYKLLTSLRPFNLPDRLWQYLLSKLAISQGKDTTISSLPPSTPSKSSSSAVPLSSLSKKSPSSPSKNPLSSVPLSSLSKKSLSSQSKNPLSSVPLSSLSKKSLNRLITLLTADSYTIAARAPFKDEFVTCGGIALSSINPSTLESRHRPHLFLAGELLDIDGITGGFNFQAAWTTAYTIAVAIAQQSKQQNTI